MIDLARARRYARLRFPAAAWLATIAAACGGDEARAPTTDELAARARAAAHFARSELDAARAELAPLLERREPAAEDLVRAAAIELRAGKTAEARALARRAIAAKPDEAGAHYVLARALEQDVTQIEDAIAAYRRVLELAPDDVPARTCLARALSVAGRHVEARALFEEVLALGVEHAGPYYVMAAHQLKNLEIELGEDTTALDELTRELQAEGREAPTEADLDVGDLAGVAPPAPTGTGTHGAGEAPRFALDATILPELGGARTLEAHDLDGDRELDLVAAGAFGLRVALREPSAAERARAHRVVTLASAEPAAFEVLDLGNDDDLDVVLAEGAALRVLEAVRERENPAGPAALVYAPAGFELPALPSPPRALLAADHDHDGDLDLLACGDFGVRLLRCDGANAAPGADSRFQGGFTDATAESGLPTDRAFAWIVSEDYDTDQDVDFLLGGESACVLASNLRGGRFEDVAPAVFGSPPRIARAPLVADLDGDARPDVLAPGEPARLWLRASDERFRAAKSALTIGDAHGTLVAADLDLNGDLDLLWRDAGALAVVALSVASDHERVERIAGPAAGGPLVACDHDRDLRHELLHAGASGIEIWRGTSAVGKAALLQWLGRKDNRRAVGAVVELRAREIYRRIYWRGDAQLAGAGAHERFDVVRVTWPNGVRQWKAEWPLGLPPADAEIEQPAGLVGSCPFLYTWNGTTYEFVSDVLGASPLGLPMAPGKLVPADSDEYVLVRGDQLVPRDDGFLELQVTEELREVTYLDRVRLEAVDHPAGTEIFPNDRFCFPPFPEAHTHTVRDPLAPRRATGSDGEDWTDELARIDDRHAVPFTPLQDQFLGLASPHWLELAFDPDAVRDAPKLRLVCTGWFFWSDASVNVAAGRTPHVRFVPPTLEVPSGAGWTPAGPPVGFPAGKTKTMVIDVSEILVRDDPRLRISSTLRLYWDSIRLATDADDAELLVQALEPASAQLWRRGFSAPAPGAPDQPERFDWERLEEHPRWDQHPGTYTRYGECVPLVTAVDDCFAVIGAGDALAVRFDARELAPPPEGFVRDWLVYLDGWAKDRDPNSVDALEVEPYPFHGMSGYPYAEPERFPDDEVHRRWRGEWQTRPAHRWVEPLAPARAAVRAQEAGFRR